MSANESPLKLNYRPEIFLEQFSVVKRFIHYLTYYRILHAAYGESNIQSEFWTHTIDAHLLQATNSWCMVFGSEGCNPTHWKKLSPSQSKEIEASFRNGFTKSTGIAAKEWENYWKEMTYFRNNYAAHRAINYSAPVPVFDLALRVAEYYDQWIRQVIQPDKFPEPSLMETMNKIEVSCTPLAIRLIATTKDGQKTSE